MEDIFDIDHWNSFHDKLPQLVDDIPQGDCWDSNVDSLLEESQELISTLRRREDAPLMERILQKQRFLKPISNISLGFVTGELAINPRRFDVSPQIQNCTHPVAYGAGGGRGRLWTDYMDYNRKQQRFASNQPDPLEETFLQALRPHAKWRELAQECVKTATKIDENSNPKPRYIALHPRVELEMMAHSCGAYMNKNMAKILEDVQQFVTQNESLRNISGVFVAFSRAGASVTEGAAYFRFRKFVDENIRTLDRVLGTTATPGHGIALGGRPVPVFECGDQLLQRYYDSQPQQPTVDYGSLLPSVINFDVAVEADVFIGFRFSSWSNSVWTTRYYLGRGDANFEYTRERGIQPIENGGLPPPHQNCDAIKDPGR